MYFKGLPMYSSIPMNNHGELANVVSPPKG